MNKTPTLDVDRRRKRALIAFQVLIYGYLLVMCLIQLHLYSHRDW